MRSVFVPYLRQGWRIGALFAIITAIATAAVVGAPQLQRNLFEAETAHEIDQLAGISRALLAQATITDSGMLLPSEPLASQFAPVTEITFPGALAPVVGTAQFSLESAEPSAFESEAAMPAELSGRALSVLADSEALERVEFIRGGPPEPNPVEVRARETDDPAELQELLFAESEPIEVAISAANSQRLGLDAGDEMQIFGFRHPTVLRVSGVFEPLDPDDLVWEAHLRGLTPFIDDDPNAGKTALGMALANPDTPGWLGALGDQRIAKVRFPVTPAAGDAGALAESLREFTAARYTISEELDPVEFTSTLAETMARLLAARDSAAVVLGVVLSGPVGAALAVSALIALISRQRRNAAHALMRARGASTLQLRGLGAAEGLLIGIPALAVGTVLGSPLLALAVALVPALALTLAPLPEFLANRSRAGNRWLAIGGIGVFALAGASVYAAQENAEQDPLTLALPVLVAASAAIILLALLPAAMRIVHRISARGRGAIAFLGTARASRESRAGWPILTLVLALGAAVFASTVLATITDGARANAYAETGADVRLSTGWLSEEDQHALASLPGVSAAAPVHRLDSISFGGPKEHRRVSVFAVDSAELARAQANLAGAADLDLADAPAGAIPALVSANLTHARGGDEVALHLGSWLELDVRGQPASVPGIAESGSWVVLDVRTLPEEALAEFPLPRLMLFATDGEESTAEEIHALGGGVVSTPHEALERVTASPVVGGLATLSWWALVFSGLLAGVGVMLFLALSAPERGYVAGIMHTLGGRAGAGLTAWEVVPAAVAGVLGGIGVGLALPYLAPLDLAAFTGGTHAPPITLDVAGAAIAVAVVGAVVVIGIAAGSLAGRRRAQRALRIGE